MSHQRHEIPTHLNVEDKAFYGLSVRQVMYLTVGISGAYALWNNWPDLSFGIRVAIALVCVVAALLLERAGTPIAGLFMQNWEEDDRNGPCRGAKERHCGHCGGRGSIQDIGDCGESRSPR